MVILLLIILVAAVIFPDELIAILQGLAWVVGTYVLAVAIISIGMHIIG